MINFVSENKIPCYNRICNKLFAKYMDEFYHREDCRVLFNNNQDAYYLS